MVMGRPDFLPAPHINEAVKKACLLYTSRCV